MKYILGEGPLDPSGLLDFVPSRSSVAWIHFATSRSSVALFVSDISATIQESKIQIFGKLW